MPDENPDALATSVLSTKVEEDFISPLTAIRGSLEILRDFPDLDDDRRLGFLAAALQECARIEKGVDDLAAAVYAAARRAEVNSDSVSNVVVARVRLNDDENIAELDFSGLEFDSAATVNSVFEEIEEVVVPTAKRWYFLVNYAGCTVFPEAWVTFAHRGKKIRVLYGFGTIRYSDDTEEESGLPSRQDAIAQISEAKKLATSS